MNVKTQVLLCVLVIAVVGFPAGCSFLPFLSQFDSTVWKANAGNYQRKNSRLQMIDGLERLIHVGDSKVKVEQHLGSPDSSSSNTYIYYLGPDDIGPHYIKYAIDFDQNGRVVKMSRRRD